VADVGFVITSRTPMEIVKDDAAGIRRRMELDTRRNAVVAERIIAAQTPRDTGRLARSVRSQQRRNRATGRFQTGFVVTVGALRDGFPYLDVTRFGHRGAVIRGAHGGKLAVHVAGRTRMPLFRRSVRAYHPGRDWVEVAVNSAARTIRKHQGGL